MRKSQPWEPISEPMTLETVAHNLRCCGAWDHAMLLATYKQDVAWLLEQITTLRAATLTAAVQAVGALEPPMRDLDEADAFRDGINAALGVLGRLGER